jgi:hypothetical protein
MSEIVMWHGSHRWEGPPEVRPAPVNALYHGPGIYMTTSPETAYGYAKGGGSLIRFVLDPSIRLAEDVFVKLEDALDFVRTQPRLKKKAALQDDLERVAPRYAERRQKLALPAEVLINLFVNYELGAGRQGPALARFLVSQGADATVVTRGLDDWLVLMNTEKILGWKKVPYGDAVEAPRGLHRRLKA